MNNLHKFCGALALAAGLVLAAFPASAHGVGSRRAQSGAIGLEFYYSTGEEMSYTPVQVFSPADSEHAYQEGYTDEEGVFAFVPNVDGAWQGICEADGGHRAVAKVDVNLAALNTQTGGAAPEVSGSRVIEGRELAVNALLGVSLLFNISAAVLLWRRRKKA